jgi:hypothetical protein
MNNSIAEHLIELPEEMQLATWQEKIEFMYQQQFETWNMARNHYHQFESVQKRDIQFDNFKITIQFNQARARSTCADLSKKVIETRRCFLCSSNLPCEQKGFILLNKYLLLVNPFPIFERHLTISDFNHIPQRIENRIIDLLEIAKMLPTYTLFYNGPMCGASAPDHFHFQAAKKGTIPFESEITSLQLNRKETIVHNEEITIFSIQNYLRSCIVFESEWKEPIDFFFEHLLEILPFNNEAGEPMMNLLASYEDDKYTLTVFPRKAQRPSCYYKEGDDRILVSPASVELGGIVVTPREEDFVKISTEDLKTIFSEVSMEEVDIQKVKHDIQSIHIA